MSENNYSRQYNLEFRKRPDDSQVGRILRGSIDMHVHCSPDLPPMRHNAVEIALDAREAGLRGIVFKTPVYPSVPLVSLVSEIVTDIAVFSGICLEYECGGFNPYAVESSAKMGAKVVWMPTYSSANSLNLYNRLLKLGIKGEGLSLLGKDGKLVPEVVEILKIIKDYDLVLATGHISSREILALVEKAKQLGVTKIVATHASWDLLSESILTSEERQTLAKEGVLIEYVAPQVLPVGQRCPLEKVVADIRNDGPSNCIIGSDSGFVLLPTEAECMRIFISAMLWSGLSEEEITCMVKTNPARLLGLAG